MEPQSYTTQPNLDSIFAALADPTRRGILARLAQGDASVSELASPYNISQPAVSKHLKVLERAGLITRGIDEQRRPARLQARAMGDAAAWLDHFRTFWGASFDQLDHVLEGLKSEQKDHQND